MGSLKYKERKKKVKEKRNDVPVFDERCTLHQEHWAFDNEDHAQWEPNNAQ